MGPKSRSSIYPPDELIERWKAGKVYIPAEATRALDRFFSKANLTALREMALRHAAMSVDRALTDHLDAQAVTGTYAGGDRVLVAVSELPGAENLVRTAKRLADALRAPWQAASSKRRARPGLERSNDGKSPIRSASRRA